MCIGPMCLADPLFREAHSDRFARDSHPLPCCRPCRHPSAPAAGRCLTNLPFANTLTGRTLTGRTLAGCTLTGRTLTGRTLAGRTLAGRTLAGRTLASHPCIHKPQYAISLPRRCPFVNAPAKGEKFCYKAGENRFMRQHKRRLLLRTAEKPLFP